MPWVKVVLLAIIWVLSIYSIQVLLAVLRTWFRITMMTWPSLVCMCSGSLYYFYL
jgi:hypothetical protein